MGDKSERDKLVSELIELNNDNIIDVVNEFNVITNKPDNKYDFFLTRRIFEKSLPGLNSPVVEVMGCVSHMIKEASSDLTAGILYTPFSKYCEAVASRPAEVLELTEESPELWVDFIGPAIISGANIDLGIYVEKAVQLVSHENIEIRKRAIFSLGNIKYCNNKIIIEKAITCLEDSIKKESDDQLLGNLIKSSFSLYKSDTSLLTRVIDLIDKSLKTGSDYAIHSASEIFAFNSNVIPVYLLDKLLEGLLSVNPANKGTIDNIDLGISTLLTHDGYEKGMDLLSSLLLNNSAELSMNSFDSVIHSILDNHDPLLNRMTTSWLLSGNRALCESVHSIVENVHGNDIKITVDKDELTDIDPHHLIFLAHKAIGFLFNNPVTCGSIIISLMHHTNDENVINDLGALLFDPLLINYSGELYEYLKSKIESEKGLIKDTINSSIMSLDQYLDSIMSIPELPELLPSQDQRETSQRRFNRLMAKSLKSAMKDSIIEMITTKSVILYGASSINHVQGGSKGSNRMVIPMQSHRTSIEMPRQENIDPFGLDYMLRIFRAEQIQQL